MSLAEFGYPRFLPASESWIQERAIPQSNYFDARGLYPLFVCRKWSNLPTDLDALQETKLVSLVVVTDPFANHDEVLLHRCFPDLVRPFKQHYIVDLTKPYKSQISKHHRYYARKSLEVVQVEVCSKPLKFLDDWVTMYEVLVRRHDIKGVQAFSRLVFERQLSLPDMIVFRAEREGRTLGMHLWIQDLDVAYSHLTAFHEDAYSLNVAYALYSYAINYFADQQVRFLDLGSGAGLSDEANDGLSWFKRGWSNAQQTVYLCGRIFDGAMYTTLAQKRSVGRADYFPVYRSDKID